jgi:hypothetical protein
MKLTYTEKSGWMRPNFLQEVNKSSLCMATIFWLAFAWLFGASATLVCTLAGGECGPLLYPDCKLEGDSRDNQGEVSCT